jgi:GT2 family glycosyltransferase
VSDTRLQEADVSGAPYDPPAGGPIADVLFVVGAPGSGLTLVRDLLVDAGLRPLDVPLAGAGPSELTGLQDRLLEALGGTPTDPPAITAATTVRLLEPFVAEARAVIAGCTSRADTPASPAAPWAWSDHRLTLLAPFWARVTGGRHGAVLVWRPPATGSNGEGAGDAVPDLALATWCRYNRVAIANCLQWPSLVIRSGIAGVDPDAVLGALPQVLRGMGLSSPPTSDAPAARSAEPGTRARAAVSPVVVPASDGDEGDRDVALLVGLLDELGGVHGPGSDDVADAPAWGPALAPLYDEAYFDAYGPEHLPYRRDEPHWTRFFGDVADSVVADFAPTTVLDVGCGIGFLVEALRQRGVDARGIDISAWAIDQVPDDLRPYCTMGSITEELEGHHDLITCVEVLEHLPPFLADDAVANLCRHADRVLFSSAPDDFAETTHLNVQEAAYWVERFARHGFVRDGGVDASFLAPHAIAFKRTERGMGAIVSEYEAVLARDEHALRRLRAAAADPRLAGSVGEPAGHLSGAPFTGKAILGEAVPGEVGRGEVPAASAPGPVAPDDAAGQERVRRRAEAQAAASTLEAMADRQIKLAKEVELLRTELDATRNTKTFRYLEPVRTAYGKLRRAVRPEAGAPTGPATPDLADPYQLWMARYDTVDDAVRHHLRSRLAAVAGLPRISVLMPVYDPDPAYLRAAIDSVLAQLYADWELCIADDCSRDARIPAVLEEYAARDPRIKVVRRAQNGHMAAASNSALELATGSWVASLDHDDALPEHALAMVALAVAERPDAGMVYSDEDKIDHQGRRADPVFKPDFDPLLLLAQNYVTHLSAYRRSLVEAVGGYRTGFEGSQDWDLILRVIERLSSDQVLHLPHVLYHWRRHDQSTAQRTYAKPYAVTTSRRAVEEHCARTGRPASVRPVTDGSMLRVRWEVPDPAPRVSIIIPTRDGAYLTRCIRSLFMLTTYPDVEIIVVDNGSQSLETLTFLRDRDEMLHVIRDEGPFNFARLNNVAARQASGDVLCLLNDDTEVIAEDWLDELVAQVMQPGVGAAGAMLTYDDGRVQHAGVILGVGGVAGHAHRGADRLEWGYTARLHTPRSVSAVTGACLAVRRAAWEELGGLDEEHLPVAFNDIDFCLRLSAHGWRVVFTPFAELIHHESASRGPDTHGPAAARLAVESRFMHGRWGELLRHDPYYNPNLTLISEDSALAWPPRVSLR